MSRERSPVHHFFRLRVGGGPRPPAKLICILPVIPPLPGLNKFFSYQLPSQLSVLFLDQHQVPVPVTERDDNGPPRQGRREIYVRCCPVTARKPHPQVGVGVIGEAPGVSSCGRVNTAPANPIR